MPSSLFFRMLRRGQTSPDETALPSASPPQVEFVFSRDNFPVMDGSTATVPLGQAVACVLLGEPRDRVADLAQFNRTTESFYNLMDGNADILIVGEPNPSVFETMKAAGFEYEIDYRNGALGFSSNRITLSTAYRQSRSDIYP